LWRARRILRRKNHHVDLARPVDAPH
jgi:hypothetical protein